MSADFISLVIPCFNEAARIQANLSRIVDFLRPRFNEFEIIVVDDGSKDGTQNEVAQARLRERRVRLISSSANRGKGFAVRQGILAARGDAVFFTDADLSTPIEAIEDGLKGIAEGCPVVIASRRHPESVIALPQNGARDAIGQLFNVVVRKLLSLRFRDTQCGFKCFSREAAREIFSLARIDGYAFDVEIIVIAQRRGYPIKEIPVHWSDSSESKVTPLGDLSGVTLDLVKIYRNERAGLYNLPE